MNILITGVSGEVGFSLVNKLSQKANHKIFGLDLKQPDNRILSKLTYFFQGSILDKAMVEVSFAKYDFDVIFHLAAILSTSAEKNPMEAYDVNVGGTLNLLESTTAWSIRREKRIKFIFPSSIAVYGLSSLSEKKKAKKVKENEFTKPITMYGINKLFCEHFGEYFSKNYRLLDSLDRSHLVDFRAIRFPGLISADTIPTGGTSDYGAEMLHSAAQKKAYVCYVRPDTQIPFMVMPDAVKSLINLMKTPINNITQKVYNVSGFSVSAKEIEKKVKKFYSDFTITYDSQPQRQLIVDSWPLDIDDSKAKRDWGWSSDYDFDKAFDEYLIPAISKKYQV